MDARELLAEFRRRYGNAWPDAAFDRLLVLAARTWRSEQDSEEYIVLKIEILALVRAGVAFMQRDG